MQAVRQARKGIERVRKHLLKPVPDSLSACAAPLSEAIQCLERLEGQLRTGAPGPGQESQALRSEIGSLRAELSVVTALLKSAGAFYEGYGALLGHTPEPEEIYYGTNPGGAYNSPRRPALIVERRLIIHG